MDQLLHKYKENDLIFLIPLVLLNLSKILGHFFWRLYSGWGFPQSADSNWYLNYAYSLINDFEIGLHMNDILYFGYNTLLALLLAVFEDTVAVLFLQALVGGLSVILVYKIAKMLFNRTTAIIASLFYYHLYDITLWATYILSESFFISLLILCVYFLLMALESEKKRTYRILFGVTSLYLLVFRPTGVISVAFMLIYIAIRIGKTPIREFICKYRYAMGGLLTLFIAVGLYLATNNVLDPFIRSFQVNIKMVLYNVYAKGWIYDMNTPYDYTFKPDYDIDVLDSLTLSFLVNNWNHVMILYGKRMIAFLGKWVWAIDLTSVKGILLFVYNALPTFLVLTGTFAAIANKHFRRASILWLMILAVFIFCVFLFIDWMYRYRSPATPFVAIVAAYGAEQIISRTWETIKKQLGLLSNGKRENGNCHTGV